MYGFFLFLGFLGVNVGFWWLLINLFRKRPKKRPALIFAAGFACIVIGGALAPATTDTVTESEAPKASEEKAVVKELSKEDKDAEAAAKKKADEEKAKAAKAEAEKQTAAEKDYYQNEIMTKVDTQMGMYDEAWDTLWVPTFKGVSEGNMDVYTAYDNMKQLQQRYQTLQSSIPAIADEGLSKEHKKTFSEYKDQLVNAAQLRESAAKKAQDMFDAGDYSPSAMDEVKVDIESADREMLNAVVSLTSLEIELGIEREE